MIEFLQHTINGLALGRIYALVALGYTLVFGVLQLINFAHGDFFMIGGFAGLYAIRFFKLAEGGSYLSAIVVLIMAMLGSAAIGMLVERFAYRPIRPKRSESFFFDYHFSPVRILSRIFRV